MERDGPEIAHTWAAWSAWRGDPKQLAQIARRALDVLEDRDPRCLIELYVKGDVERFESPDDFLARASLNALQRFDAVRIRVDASSLELVVTAAREDFDSLGVRRGVALVVRGPRAASVAVRNAVAASVDRGGFWFSSEPRSGDTQDGLSSAQQGLTRRRRLNVFVALGLPLGASLLMTLFALSDWWWENVFWSGLLVLAVALVLWALLAWAPRVADLLFPAIDIADVTPGRRTLRQLAALPLIPAITWLATSVAENV